MSPAGAGPARSANQALLALYLNDHVTGATAGLELFERAAQAQRSGPAGPELARLTQEIREDRETYMAIMASLGVRVRPHRMALAWVGEKVTRLKGNGRLVRRSPLSDLVELEALHLGVSGKEAGWRTLRIVAEYDDRLDAGQLDALIDRAARQRETLERLRREESRRLLGRPDGPRPAATSG